MGYRHYSVDVIVRKLRAAEVELSRRRTVREVSRKLEINEQTFYRWRKEYGSTGQPGPSITEIVPSKRARSRLLSIDSFT